MTTRVRRTQAAVAAMIAFMAIQPVCSEAQSVPSPTAPGALAGDPPGRVARLNYFTGNVTLEPAGATEWSYAQPNRPLTTGDQLWADAGARGELHAGSTALRLDQQTALSIIDLDDATLQVKVGQGALSTRVRALPNGQTVEIDTPNVALQATSPGEFRVDVAPDGSSTTVTVRAGTATLYGDGASYAMSAGQQARFIGENLQQQSGGPAPGPDAFDQWVASRDRAEDGSVSARYVSREIPGYEDLDANGTWRADPSYGEVWVPTVAVSQHWAPYHEGHWAWIAPWGWTWVDDAPWGFAPFHYGRWAYVGNAWAWVPGPVETVQPVYAPALVAFVDGDGGGGGGSHWGVDLAVGGAVGIGAGVAWFALGPHEAWHPSYHASPAYFGRVNYGNVNNITNVRNTTIVNNIHNTYINQTAPGAITAVPASAFVRGQPVAGAARVLSAQQIARARIGAGGPDIAPVRESFTGGMRPASIGAPAALAQREVVATRRPVVPAAYRDTLAQRFAGSGGRVPGAGDPVVRTTVPAAFMANANGNAVGNANARAVRPGMPAGGRPQGAYSAPQGYRLVDKTQARPVGPQGAIARGNEGAVPGHPGPVANGAITAMRPMNQPGQVAQAGREQPPMATHAARPNEGAARPGEHVQPGQAQPPVANAARPNEGVARPGNPAVAAPGPQREAPQAAHGQPQPPQPHPEPQRAEPQQRVEPQHAEPQRSPPQQHVEQPRPEPQHVQQPRPEPQQAPQPRPEQHAQPQHEQPREQPHEQPQQPHEQPHQQPHEQPHEQPHPQNGEHHDEQKK